ncbi:MAG: hypothetical protein RI936_21 [Pseudomonadota bacterium]|jgi:hypothetical protein
MTGTDPAAVADMRGDARGHQRDEESRRWALVNAATTLNGPNGLTGVSTAQLIERAAAFLAFTRPDLPQVETRAPAVRGVNDPVSLDEARLRPRASPA